MSCPPFSPSTFHSLTLSLPCHANTHYTSHTCGVLFLDWSLTKKLQILKYEGYFLIFSGKKSHPSYNDSHTANKNPNQFDNHEEHGENGEKAYKVAHSTRLCIVSIPSLINLFQFPLYTFLYLLRYPYTLFFRFTLYTGKKYRKSRL